MKDPHGLLVKQEKVLGKVFAVLAVTFIVVIFANHSYWPFLILVPIFVVMAIYYESLKLMSDNGYLVQESAFGCKRVNLITASKSLSWHDAGESGPRTLKVQVVDEAGNSIVIGSDTFESKNIELRELLGIPQELDLKSPDALSHLQGWSDKYYESIAVQAGKVAAVGLALFIIAWLAVLFFRTTGS